MIHIGMIFQYDAAQGTGTMMFSDANKREFNTDNWVDAENVPTIGQKVSCEHVKNTTHIKVADTQEQITSSPTWVDKVAEDDEEDEVAESFDTVDEYISHYTDMGFKLVKDSIEDASRVANLRIYTPEDYGEVTLVENGSHISVKQVMNGKTVVNT